MNSIRLLVTKLPCKPAVRFTAVLLILSFAAFVSIAGGPVVAGLAASTGAALTGSDYYTAAPRGMEANAEAAVQSNCTFALSANRYISPAAGGSSSVNLITQDNCSWTVVNNTPWIVMISGPTGQGSRAVNFFVQPHSGAPRTGTITIAGLTFTVEQVGTLPCSFSIDPRSQSFGTGGGTGLVNVAATIGCEWGASSGASWVHINSGATGIGSGTVMFTVEANTGGPRIGTLLIAGQTYNVVQDGSFACSVTIDPTNQNFGTSGGAGKVNVKAVANCIWAAVSNVPWVTITSGTLGSGDGEVTFLVAANSGPGRTGTINISGQLFTITQDGTSSGCVTFIKPDNRPFNASGGLGVISVTAPEACSYVVLSNRDWLRITTGTVGHGNGVVRYTVQANTTGLRRTGTIFIDGQDFLITQTR